MLKQRTFFLPFCLLPFLQACNSDSSDILDALNANRAKWENKQISDYQFESQLSCFCSQETSDPRLVLVENNEIISIANMTTKARLQLDEYDTQTISELFHRIAIEESRAESLTVSYHPELGYPTFISVDGDKQIADDEYTITVSDLIPADEVTCAEVEVPGISLSIFDNNEPAACGVTITVEDKDDNQTVVTTDENCDASAPVSLLPEQDGYFDITIEKPGYNTVTLNDTGIAKDLCHVITRDISVTLIPTE